MNLRYLSGLMLLAAIPMGLYALEKSVVVAVAILNVCIVAASLYYMFGPAAGDTAHAV